MATAYRNARDCEVLNGLYWQGFANYSLGAVMPVPSAPNNARLRLPDSYQLGSYKSLQGKGWKPIFQM
jgi:hypothetical protein